MYMICWIQNHSKRSNKKWEIIAGEDAMQKFVSDLEYLYDVKNDDILVFNMEDELNNKEV